MPVTTAPPIQITRLSYQSGVISLSWATRRQGPAPQFEVSIKNLNTGQTHDYPVVGSFESRIEQQLDAGVPYEAAVVWPGVGISHPQPIVTESPQVTLVQYDGAGLQVRWNRVGGYRFYSIVLQQLGGISKTQSVVDAAPSLTCRFPGALASGNWSIGVAAQDQYRVSIGPPASRTVITEATTMTLVANSGTAVVYTWDAAGGGGVEAYAAHLQTPTTSWSVATNAATLTATFNQMLAGQGTCTGWVQATSRDGVVIGPSTTVVRLITEPPVLNTLDYDDGHLDLGWAPNSGAPVTDYVATIAETGQQPRNYSIGVNGIGTVSVTLATDGTYDVSIRATAPRVTGPPSNHLQPLTTRPNAPTLTATAPSGFEVAWPADPNPRVTGYLADFLVNGVSQGALARSASPADFAGSTATGVIYQCRVRSTAAQLKGPWTALVSVEAIDPVLRALEARLMPSATGQPVILNETTIAAPAVVSLLGLLLDPTHPTLTVTSATLTRGPQNESIIVTGQAVLPGGVQTSVHAVFEAPGHQLALRLELGLSDWRFSQSFAELSNTFFDELDLSDPSLVLTSLPGTYRSADERRQAEIAAGLNFIADVLVNGPLNRATAVLGAISGPVLLAGTISGPNGKRDVRLTTPTLTASPSLSIAGIPTLGLSQPAIGVESLVSTKDGMRRTRALLYATANFGAQLRIAIQLPTGIYGWMLSPASNDAAALTLADLLPAVNGQRLTASVLPTSLVSVLSAVRVSALSIRFSPAPNTPTFIDFTVSYEAGWTVIPDRLTLAPIELIVNIAHHPTIGTDAAQTQIGGRIAGMLTIDRMPISLSLEIPPASGMDWTLRVAEPGVAFPTVSGLASLLGERGLDGANLPSDMGSPSGFVLGDLEVAFNPFSPSLSYVSFAAGYARDWPVMPGVPGQHLWRMLHRHD